MCLEAEDRDIVLLGLVQLTELGAELVFGDVCAVGVENIAIMATVRPCRPELLPVLYFLHLHDHLATTEEGVADELARAQGNLRVGHIGGWYRPVAR